MDAPLRTAAKMRKATPDCDPGNWRHLVGDTGKTDAKDRHVAAAAVACSPSRLLTWNLGHFDAEHLKDRRVAVQDPGDFLCEIYDGDPLITHEASLKAHGFSRSSAMQMPTWAEYLDRLSANGLGHLAARLRNHSLDGTLTTLPEILSDRDEPG